MLELWRRAEAGMSSTDDPQGVRLLIDCDPDALLLAFDGADMVGTLVAAWDGWRGTMYRLAVAPTHRRTGVATRLVQSGEERLAALGARRIGALVLTGESCAAPFWRLVGYELDPRVDRFAKNLEERRPS